MVLGPQHARPPHPTPRLLEGRVRALQGSQLGAVMENNCPISSTLPPPPPTPRAAAGNGHLQPPGCLLTTRDKCPRYASPVPHRSVPGWPQYQDCTLGIRTVARDRGTGHSARAVDPDRVLLQAHRAYLGRKPLQEYTRVVVPFRNIPGSYSPSGIYQGRKPPQEYTRVVVPFRNIPGS